MRDLNSVERRAERLLKAAGVTSHPVPLNKIAEHLRIRIQYADLGNDCSGVLVRNPSSKGGVIGVNWAHHANRQRFTVAHEIGHYVLHDGNAFVDKHYRVNFRTNTGSGTQDQEIEANRFAAALLMPRKWVVHAFQYCDYDFTENDDNELTELAHDFGVSPQAMAIRLSVVMPNRF